MSGLEIDYTDLKIAEDQSCWHEGRPFTGVARHVSDTGQVESLVSYSDGVQSGPFKDFYDSGVLKMEGMFQNGVYHGECRSWHSSGKLASIESFEHGILVSAQEWDENDLPVRNWSLDPSDPKWAFIEKVSEGI